MADELAGELAALQQTRKWLSDAAYQAALQQLRTTYGDWAVDAALQPDAPSLAYNVTQNVTGTTDIAVAGSVYGNIYLNGTRGKTEAELIRSYLTRVVQQCKTLPLQGVYEQRGTTDVLDISLEHVYTQLAVTATIQRETFHGEKLRTLDVATYWQEHCSADLQPRQQRTRLSRSFTRSELAEKRESLRFDLSQTLTTQEVDSKLPDFATGTLLKDNIPQLEELEHVLPEIPWLTFYGPQLVTEAISNSPHLVLLGEPGSGKSTALRYIALTLAEAGLDESIDRAQKLPGWEQFGDQGRLLPIVLPLLPLAKALAKRPNHRGNADDLRNAIAEHLNPNNAYPGLAAAVQEEIDAGRVLLMLDGLDEVPGTDPRQQFDEHERATAAHTSARANVIRAVLDFARLVPQCRIVVACRVRAYEGEQNAAWQLPGWPSAKLADWTLGQMHAFFAAWYREAAKGRPTLHLKLDERIADLQQAVANRNELRSLGKTPLLLTIMALVHLNDQQLPRDRVALYARCLTILLSQWEAAGKIDTEYGALMHYIGLPDLKVEELLPLLMWAASVAHAASDGASVGRIDRDKLYFELARRLALLKHPDAHDGALRFLHYTDTRAGLLHASDAGDAFAFPHQTFQEYLAGMSLVSGPAFVNEVINRRNDDRWRVPIFLGIGHAVTNNLLSVPYQLFQRLLTMRNRSDQQRQADVLFAAELACDVGWQRFKDDADEYHAQIEVLANALVQVVEGSALSAHQRIQAGVLLGQLGDPRPGVCSLPPAMAPISGGTFFIGEAPGSKRYAKEVNQAPLTLASFELARYPVTNAQYALFLDDDGYDLNKPWWDEAGRAWLRDEKRTEPSYWHDSRFGQSRPNHPVVGVSWYEARAFAAWLTEHSEFNPGRQWIYQLPSEAEWEYAARGTTRRTYPWGSEDPDAERANFRGTYDGTTAVGCFPQGATEQCIYDLAGNILEWTRSLYIDYPYDPNDGREQPDDPAGKQFTLRGGGWYNQPLFLRASYRGRNTPVACSFDVGFRLARHLPGKD